MCKGKPVRMWVYAGFIKKQMSLLWKVGFVGWVLFVGANPSWGDTPASAKHPAGETNEKARQGSVSPVLSAGKSKDFFQEGLRQFESGHFKRAQSLLVQAMTAQPTHEGIRYYLARTYIRLAQQTEHDHNIEKRRALLKQALEVDPRLLEDNSFVQQYKRLQVDEKNHQVGLIRKRKPRKSPKSKLLSLGVGLTFGVEGLLGIQTGLLIGGMVNPLVTFSPVQQSFDFTLKIIPLRRYDWSPYLSVGVTLPTSNTPHSPFPAFPDPFFHFALGIQYHSPIGFAFSTGLSLSYHLGGTNAMSFIPIPSAHISWYF